MRELPGFFFFQPCIRGSLRRANRRCEEVVCECGLLVGWVGCGCHASCKGDGCIGGYGEERTERREMVGWVSRVMKVAGPPETSPEA